MARPLKPGERLYLDAESRTMIYQGCSVNQLGEIFNIKPPDVMKKLAGLEPVGTGRQGNPIYRLRDAATRLVKVEITADMIHEYMQRANPKDLPSMTNKLFWEGLMSRRKYEELTGDLWHSADVSSVASTTYQAIRAALLLLPDTLMSEAGLNETQVQLSQGVIDTALEDVREQLIRDLRKPSGEPRLGTDAEEGEL